MGLGRGMCFLSLRGALGPEAREAPGLGLKGLLM